LCGDAAATQSLSTLRLALEEQRLMSATDLPKQIARMQQSIARLEAKAARCNGGTELGRAIAIRAEKSATHYRKHLEKLQHQINSSAVPDLQANATTTSSAPPAGADVAVLPESHLIRQMDVGGDGIP
jgi:hypothetical protein